MCSDAFDAPVFTSFESSSELPIGMTADFFPANAFDGVLTTLWQEGADGNGVGEWIMCSTDSVQCVKKVSICNGALSSAGRDYLNNDRPAKLTMTTDIGFEVVLELEDNVTSLQTFDLGTSVYCKSIKFTIEETYKGEKWEDTAISEIQFE